MLNRLMFIYFIQKKGFLDGDPDYLRHTAGGEPGAAARTASTATSSARCSSRALPGGRSERSAADEPPAGPGALPERRPLRAPPARASRTAQTIQIPDAAFERLFDFFDAYHWHLDERPLRADNEINPDVLGYIFEKYINQKQMGAYYTKEDITGYISQNTIILLHLLDRGCGEDVRGSPSSGR